MRQLSATDVWSLASIRQISRNAVTTGEDVCLQVMLTRSWGKARAS